MRLDLGRRSVGDPLGADRQAGAGFRAAGAGRTERRARASTRRRPRRQGHARQRLRLLVRPLPRRASAADAARRATRASGWSASTTRTCRRMPRRFLGELGNPYAAIGADDDGRDGDRLGRLRRARDVPRRTRRHHPPQVHRPAHARRRSPTDLMPAIEKALTAAELSTPPPCQRSGSRRPDARSMMLLHA